MYDFNGDGNDDYVMGYNWVQWPPSTLDAQVGTGLFSPIIRFNAEPSGDSTYAAFMADVNGDGDLDLIDGAESPCLNAGPGAARFRVCPPKIRYGSSRRMHLMTNIVDGVGRKLEIVYNGNSKVTRNTTCAGSDLICPTKFPPLVGEHQFSTISPQGVERKRKSFDYSYANARAGTNGRGSYGFGNRSVREYEFVGGVTPILFSSTSTSYYNEDFARAGLLKTRTVTTGQASQSVPGFVLPVHRIVEETRVYDSRKNEVVTTADPSLTIVFPVLRQSTTQNFDVPDVTRQVVSTVVTDFVSESIYDGYDDYGNNLYQDRRVYAGDVTDRLVGDNFVVRHFKAPDIDNWLVGLLSSNEVRDTRGAVTETRKWTYDYHDDGSGRLHLRTRDPGGAFQQVEEFLYEDGVHNLTQVILQPGDDRARKTTVAYDDSSLTFPFYTYDALGHRTTTTFDPRHGQIVRDDRSQRPDRNAHL